jgi:hypothetical protein
MAGSSARSVPLSLWYSSNPIIMMYHPRMLWLLVVVYVLEYQCYEHHGVVADTHTGGHEYVVRTYTCTTYTCVYTLEYSCYQ